MAIQFESMLVAGTVLIREDIESQNYVTGVSGWAIFANGDAEFNNGIFRGQLTAGSITSGSIGDSTIINSTFNDGTINNSNFIIDDSDGGVILAYGVTQASSVITADTTFVVPAGVTSIRAEAWGAGGGGSGAGSTHPGGGGGEYAAEMTLAVTPLENLTIDVGALGAGGASGSAGSAGAATTIKRGATTLVRANGGAGGVNGTIALGGSGSTNSVHFSGGSSPVNNIALDPRSTGGSGGGGSAGTSSAGNNGSKHGGGTAAGAGGVAVTGGGAGGAGGAGTGVSGVTASNGAIPGGGGGAGGQGSGGVSAGGNGARGQVRFTWNTGQTLVASVAPAAGVDSFGNAYPQGLSALLVHAGLLQADNIFVGTFNTGAMVTNSVNVVAIAYGPLTGTSFFVFCTPLTGTVGAGNSINEIGVLSANSTGCNLQVSVGSVGAARNIAVLVIGA